MTFGKPPGVPCPPRNPHCHDIIDSVPIDGPIRIIAIIAGILTYLLIKKKLIKMTRKQHLQKLPLQKRLQAMENIRREESPAFSVSLNREISEAKMVLLGAFDFMKNRQSFDYWWNISWKYFG